MYNKPILNNFSSYNQHFEDVYNRQRKRNQVTEEGVIVNTFIKESDSDDTDLPVKQTPLPDDMFVKKEKIAGKWFNNPVLPMIIAPISVLAVGAGLAAFYKKSLSSKYALNQKMQIPPNGRIIAVNNDTSISLLALVQDPSRKNFHAAAAVIAASATAFILKTTVDGFKEVLVKKQAADIKRDKDEQLIDIETRSFSGKNQIIRSMIFKKADELKGYEIPNQNSGDESSISFAQLKQKLGFKSKTEGKDSEDKGNPIKTLGYVLLGVVATGVSLLCAKSIFKNIRYIDKKIEEKAGEVSDALAKELKGIENAEALKTRIETEKLSNEASDIVKDKWSEIHDPSHLVEPPKEISGSIDVTRKRGKTGFSSVVRADAVSFIYTWLIHPTKQTATLASLMCAAAGLGYIGQAAVKGVKEIQVEKANAKTEVDLHDRLVQVELKNFYAKKNSYIKPVMEDAKEKLKTARTKEERKKIRENVLSEIKNGPPFVYS